MPRNSWWPCNAAARTAIPASPPIRRWARPSTFWCSNGGTGILSETPEIYGAEHLLTRRAANREVGEKLVDIIKWWEDYTKRNLMEMNNNPSPGNKLGGLTTILEKSLGAAAKGGTTHAARRLPLCRTGDRPRASSSWTRPATIRSRPPARWRAAPISCASPPAAARPMAASRCPSIKLATNTDIYNRMIDDMDINCGDMLDGVSIEDKGQRDLRHDAQGRLGPEDQVRRAGLWRQRISCPGRSAR